MASLYKKPVVIRDPKTGGKVKTKSKKWWGRYTDSLGCEKRVPLATDKTAAQSILKALIHKVERQKAGLEYPIDKEMQKPIATHLADFEKSQKSKNNSPRYVTEIVANCAASLTLVAGAASAKSRLLTCRASWPT